MPNRATFMIPGGSGDKQASIQKNQKGTDLRSKASQNAGAAKQTSN